MGKNREISSYLAHNIRMDIEDLICIGYDIDIISIYIERERWKGNKSWH